MEAAGNQFESCDYISDLPDNVLDHILSLLPIKDVIRTSFISRRWRCLWTSVPTLDFDGLVFSPKTKFMKFVNSVLLRRENCGIQKFSLRFSGYYCTSIHVNEWILSAVDHNVRELSISFYTLKTFELPSFIFTCRSLTALTLYLNCSTLNVPSSIHLPFLKTLHLTAVAFSDDSLPLFSNCPILENVHLEGCLVTDLTILNVSSTSLQRLTIDGFPKDYFTFNDVVHDFVIRVSAPRLLTLEYKDYRVQNICLEHMSSLKNAFIDLNFDWNGKEHICRHRVGILLRGLSNVEFLKISSAIIKLLSAAPNLLSRFPTFYNLKHLKLSADISNEIHVVSCFLQSSPYLELLSIELCPRRHLFDTKESLETQNSECVVDNLKIINIRSFTGNEQEIIFVKYLLMRACALERMIIVCSKQFSINLELQTEIGDGILLHPRGSPDSEVTFVTMR